MMRRATSAFIIGRALQPAVTQPSHGPACACAVCAAKTIAKAHHECPACKQVSCACVARPQHGASCAGPSCLKSASTSARQCPQCRGPSAMCSCVVPKAGVACPMCRSRICHCANAAVSSFVGSASSMASSSAAALSSAAGAALSAQRRGLTYKTPDWVDSLRDAAKAAENNISYDIKIYDDLAWQRRPFTFNRSQWEVNSLSKDLRQRLCLGDEYREYTVIGEAFPFADRDDSPVINEPNVNAKLLWDHTSPTEKIMIQLGPQFPPLLWLTVKPTLPALQKVFREFIDADADHMKRWLPYYEAVQNDTERLHGEKFGEDMSAYKLRDQFVDDMRKRDPSELGLEYNNCFMLFLGYTEHFSMVEDKMRKKNPFVFSWPLLLSEGNHHFDNSNGRQAVFRTIFSKSRLTFLTRTDLQVDPRQCANPSDPDSEEVPLLETPVTGMVMFPTNTRMCGGKALVDRFNKVMGTSFPLTTPVDVLGAFAADHCVKTQKELKDELDFLDAATKRVPDVERVIRVHKDHTGANRIIGQLAHCILNIALLDLDPGEEDGAGKDVGVRVEDLQRAAGENVQERWVVQVIKRFMHHDADMVRMACAKAAVIIQDVGLVQAMYEKEPEGRPKHMLKLCLDECMDSVRQYEEWIAKHGAPGQQPQQ